MIQELRDRLERGLAANAPMLLETLQPGAAEA